MHNEEPTATRGKAPSPFSYDPRSTHPGQTVKRVERVERDARTRRTGAIVAWSLVSVLVLAGLGLGAWSLFGNRDGQEAPPPAAVEETPEDEATTEPTEEPTPEPEPQFDLTAHSIDDPNSIWLVVNKHRPLDPADFTPADLAYPQTLENEFGQPLRAEVATAVDEMFAAAQAEGVWFRIISAHRDYWVQDSLYTSYVNRDGALAADRYSARPGHSEHQTGLAVDFDDWSGCYLSDCFRDTTAGIWLAENAADYGFILRYQPGYEEVTGFMPEPWHFRYVGVALAQHMKAEGIVTLEELFGLDAAPDYLG